MDGEQLLLESLPEVERVVAFVCRRHAVPDAEAEDFSSYVKLRLIENDYAVLRKFKGESTLRTYLSVVIQRLLSDYRNHLLGKWRPTAEAKRLGEPAVKLETLLHRDKFTLDEAIAVLQASRGDLEPAALRDLAERLPRRLPQRRQVSLADVPDEFIAENDSDRDVWAAENDAVARKTKRIVRRVIDDMSEQDRLALRMRFEVGMSVVQIARALQTELAPLYRRIYRSLATMRSRLEREGVHIDDIDRIVSSSDDLDFGLSPARPSEATPGDKETPA
jgi:RNA polymerase sigma factor for flagellar operon FliA